MSNIVVLVDAPEGRLVLKQALGKLRVEQDWFSDRERIFRESQAIARLGPHLPRGALPEVLFEDRPNLLFAMSAAPRGWNNWKSELLRGAIDERVAEAAAVYLTAMISASRGNAEWKKEFEDQTVFDQLRLDPYYRGTALRHPDLASHFAGLMDESRARRVSLVHGDWSPKNLLVGENGVMAIDFEVIHYGDPSFDSAFLLNHLILKSFHLPHLADRFTALARRFWNTLLERLSEDRAWLEAATLRHLGCLMLARVDGKSPAEYLTAGERDAVRQFARRLILEPPATLEEALPKT